MFLPATHAASGPLALGGFLAGLALASFGKLTAKERKARAAVRKAAVKKRQARAAAEAKLVEPAEAIQRIEARFGPGSAPKALPSHIEPYANFMLAAKGRPITKRELIKAYATTRSSIQRQAVTKPKLCARFPEYPELTRLEAEAEAEAVRVRPEDAFAVLLRSPRGQRYLEAAERGAFDAEAAREIADRTTCFGFQNTLFDDMAYAVRLGERTDEVRAALALPREGWIEYVRDNISGVSAAKAGFLAALLGRGDVPTFDAREVSLWSVKRPLTDTQKEEIGCDTRETPAGNKVFSGTRGGQADRRCKNPPDPKLEDVLAYTGRVQNYPLTLKPEHEPFREHLVHHALWDAYPEADKVKKGKVIKAEQSKTTHGSVIRAMQFAGLARRR